MEAGMFLRRFTILAALFLTTGLLRAQTATNLPVSSEAASWLDLAYSARIEGMGEAYVAVADDVNALGVNPAGLGKLNEAQISLTHDSYVQGADIEQAMGSFALGPGNVALGLTYGNFGNVQEYTVTGGVPLAGGTYQPIIWKMDLGYGLTLIPDLYAGLSGKFLIDDTTLTQETGFAGDAGLLWTPKDSGLGFGLSALNVGSLSGESLPTEMRGGVSYKFDVKNEGNDHQTLLVSLDALARFVDITSNREAIGFEYHYHDHLFLRLGQQLMDTTGLSGWSGLSVGAGLKIDKIQIDYAFATRGDLGNLNLISLVSGF
jgi:hypothetical protein